MRKRLILLFVLLALPLGAQEKEKPKQPDANRANLAIEIEPLGDTERGVAARITFRFAIPSDVPPEIPLVVQGSILQAGAVLRNFRILVPPEERQSVKTIQTLPEGSIDVEARLMIPLEEQAPVLLGKALATSAIRKLDSPYIASIEEGAESVFAEGAVPETLGAVKIRAPRRDLSPNLFIVDVDVKPPVKRVEFWVEGKKIVARNAPPYRAELDLGKLPKRVEVKAIGYDSAGRYIDADAFVVNERETPLEVKITRVDTPDGITHFKLSIQNPKNSRIKSVTMFAGQKKIREWSSPPYALDVPTASLAGIEFVRASVLDDTNYEASDLVFLSGDRYVEQIEVNLVELPVSVADATGAPIVDLTQSSFTVLEDGKPQKISAFNFASNLPLSVGVLLDHSGSMKGRIKEAKEAASEFFRSIIKEQDRAFFGAFSFDSTKVAPFVTSVAAIQQQVTSSPEAEGGTSLYDAIVTGLYRFRSVQGRKALIIISDGEDTTSRLTYDEMLMYTRASRVPLYFIGVGMGFGDFGGTAKMKSLAAETGGVVYLIRDVKQLKETYAQLEKDLRSQYLLSYYAESSRQDQKYRTIEVKVDRSDARVRTIRGYIP